MKTIYFECLTGVSGDMILASLIDSGQDVAYLKQELSKLKIDFKIDLKEKKVAGIKTKSLEIIEDSPQPLRKKKDIERIIKKSELSDKVIEKSIEILNILGKAEAEVHGTCIEEIHFHEIGAIDTIIDIVGSVLLIDNINPYNVICSKINLGSGFVETEHGKLPVPAPASSEIAKDMKTFSTDSDMELSTPTGLAILKGFSKKFGSIPESKIKSVGYGSGTRSNDKNPNMLRTFILEESKKKELKQYQEEVNEYTDEIHTNIDDCTPEILGNTMENLFKSNALDVYFTPIQMKKQRPGTKLSVICNKEDTNNLVNIIFKETTTTGVRINETRRKKVIEKIEKIELHGQNIRVKMGYIENELLNVSPEFEDCKKLAIKNNLSLKFVLEQAKEKAKKNIETKDHSKT